MLAGGMVRNVASEFEMDLNFVACFFFFFFLLSPYPDARFFIIIIITFKCMHLQCWFAAGSLDGGDYLATCCMLGRGECF